LSGRILTAVQRRNGFCGQPSEYWEVKVIDVKMQDVELIRTLHYPVKH
jgi:hypothetical protein